MLLVIDVGNTNTVLGAFDGATLRHQWRVETSRSRTSDEWGILARQLFAAALLTLLEQWLDRHAEEGFEPIREAWRERSATLGREVRVEADGGEVDGVAEDLDETGALLVRAAGRRIRVAAGDVRLLRPR